MRRSLIAAIALFGFGGLATPAHAAPPEHDSLILKDVHQTVVSPPECPAASPTVDIVYNLQLHATFTDETFHVTETISGTWSNALGAGGHFVSQSSQQGPGYPIYAETSVLTVTGVSPTGERVQLRLLFHITIDANGDVTSFVEDANC